MNTALTTISRFVRNRCEIKFAYIQLTTRCNAKCVDRCNIWNTAPVDISFEDLKYTADILAENRFCVMYFTGGEPSLYPHLVEAVKYAKSKGMITSLTSNGSITRAQLRDLRDDLDVLSISVDHYDGAEWDKTKRVKGISNKALEAIEAAKDYGINVSGLTFINPTWDVETLEKTIKYVDKTLDVSFACCYPCVSANNSTFVVGKRLTLEAQQSNLKVLFGKMLQMKREGYNIAEFSEYLKDVQMAHANLPMKHPCKAGRLIILIDCNLDVFPCFKRGKLFNLRDPKNRALTFGACPLDDKNCLTGCFKEPSIASKWEFLDTAVNEFLQNPAFYFKIIKGGKIK